MKKVFMFIIILFSVSQISFSQVNQDFRLINNTGVTIHEIYVAPATDVESWGPDLLNGTPLQSGESLDITFDKSDFPDDCVWDMAVLDNNGASLSWGGLNLCQWYTITLHWDADKVEGWATFSESLQELGDNESNSSNDANSLGGVLTNGTWKMMFNGESYGTIKFDQSGTVIKTAEGASMETSGTWALEGNNITLNFPDEGGAFAGTITPEGDNLIATFMDGAITYTYIPQ